MDFPRPPLQPMEPVKRDRPFDSGDWSFQVKWDGVRILLFYDGARVILQNRRLHDRTEQYPELQHLPDVIGQPVVLDGEIIALKDGKPSFPTVMKRDRIISRAAARSLIHAIPIAFMIFDVLYCQGRLVTRLPWQERQGMLDELLPAAAAPFYRVESFPQGIRLFEQVAKMGLEGIVAKVKDSPYIPGGKSRLWQKIKHRPLVTCTIGGFTRRGQIINSLLAGVFDEDRLLYVGRVGSGLRDEEWIQVTRVLSTETVKTPPFINPPRSPAISWVQPLHQMTVEYAEWTEETRLRAPVIKSITI